MMNTTYIINKIREEFYPFTKDGITFTIEDLEKSINTIKNEFVEDEVEDFYKITPSGIRVVFRGNVNKEDGSYRTLDGKNKISCIEYQRMVNSIDELCEEEIFSIDSRIKLIKWKYNIEEGK